MQKRGQFYLIATALIVLIIFGLVSISNAAIVQPRPVKFYDLSQDYSAETARVIDYGIYNKISSNVNISEKIKNISGTFASSAFAKDPNVRLLYIYGNQSSIDAEGLSVTGGSIDFCSAESCSTNEVWNSKGLEKTNYTKNGNNITVILGGNEYLFTLTGNDNFYFVIQTITPANERIVSVKS